MRLSESGRDSSLIYSGDNYVTSFSSLPIFRCVAHFSVRQSAGLCLWDVYSLQVKSAARKTFGYKSEAILAVFFCAWSFFEYSVRYRRNFVAFISEAGWIYFVAFCLLQFFFFKLVSVSGTTMEIVKVFNPIRRKQVFDLTDIYRVVLRTGPGMNSMDVYTNDAKGTGIVLGMSWFELRGLRDALLARGIRVDDFI